MISILLLSSTSSIVAFDRRGLDFSRLLDDGINLILVDVAPISSSCFHRSYGKEDYITITF